MKPRSYFLTWHYRANRLLYSVLIGVLLLAATGPVRAGASVIQDENGPSARQLTAPLPPPALTITELTDKKLSLNWQKSAGAVQYRLYRNTIQGTYAPANLIYTFVVTSPLDEPKYTDSNFELGLHVYYYVVTAVNSLGEESGFSNEVSGLPHYQIDWAGMVYAFPTGDLGGSMVSNFSYTLGNPALRPVISGEIYIAGRTGGDEPEPDVTAQFGFGPAGADPATELVDLTQWTTWQDAYFYGQGLWAPANSRYLIDFLPESPGQFYYVYRFSTTGGRNWTYASTQITVPDPTKAAGSTLGLMTINNNSADSEPPVPPVLSVTGVSETTVSLDWTESTSPDIYAYDLYRSLDAGELGQRVSGGRWLAGEPTEYIDTGLVAGTGYYYRIIALDNSFNAAESNQASAETYHSPVTFTLNVTIPAVTPGPVYINRAYDQTARLFGEEDWTGIPLNCNYAARLCTVELIIQENATLNFNFSRGSQDTIQTQFDGNSPAINPSFTVEKGMTVVNRIIANWDDPLVTEYAPQGSEISLYSDISVTWNQDMPLSTLFTLLDMGSDGSGPGIELTGEFSYDPVTHILKFNPEATLKANWHYQVDVGGQPDLTGVFQQVSTVWTFTTGNYLHHLPMIRR